MKSKSSHLSSLSAKPELVIRSPFSIKALYELGRIWPIILDHIVSSVFAMGFTTPSHIPELPFPPPDSVPVHEFLFGEQSNYGRHPIDSSNPPFTCGLTAKAYSAPDVAKRIDYLARALASQLGWQVNEGDELDKVICTFSVNTVNLSLSAYFKHLADDSCFRLIH
jgi:hypothetical protein